MPITLYQAVGELLSALDAGIPITDWTNQERIKEIRAAYEGSLKPDVLPDLSNRPFSMILHEGLAEINQRLDRIEDRLKHPLYLVRQSGDNVCQTGTSL